MNTYEVVAEPDDNYWALEVVGIGYTQARFWGEIELMAADLVHCVTDLPLSEIEVSVRLALPAGIEEHVANAKEARLIANEAESRAVSEALIAARQLRDQGCSVRDIGHVLNLSHQRVHQLLKSA